MNARRFKFCFECPEYENRSCEKFEKFSEEYLRDDGVNLRANLARIEAGKVEEWLRESEEKYRCPVCKKPLSYGALKKRCYHCGKDLSK